MHQPNEDSSVSALKQFATGLRYRPVKQSLQCGMICERRLGGTLRDCQGSGHPHGPWGRLEVFLGELLLGLKAALLPWMTTFRFRSKDNICTSSYALRQLLPQLVYNS